MGLIVSFKMLPWSRHVWVQDQADHGRGGAGLGWVGLPLLVEVRLTL